MFKKSSMAICAALLLLNHAVVGQERGSANASPSLQPTAPDTYTVRSGDTLWSIAARFLKEPWRWPDLWRFNEEQIRNPHEIRPGQVLVLDRQSGRLSMRGGARAAGVQDIIVTPRARVERQDADAVPSIPSSVIEPWLTRPLVIDAGELAGAPRIVAAEEGRYHLGAGGRAYVQGLPADARGSGWMIYRTGRPLIDPDTKDTLGYEAVYVGTATIERPGSPAAIRVRSAVIEVAQGDHLVPEAPARVITYMPRAPKADIRARIISIYGGRGDAAVFDSQSSETRIDVANYDSRREAGPLQIISVNRGANDGLEVGHVLALHRTHTVVNDRSVGKYYLGAPRLSNVTLPEEQYGVIFVFRTFPRVSYAMIMGAERSAVPGDAARTP